MEIESPSACHPLAISNDVEGDAINPRAQAGPVLEVAKTPEHPQVDVLAHIVDLVPAQQRERQSSDRQAMRRDQLANRLVVMGQARRDEKALVLVEALALGVCLGRAHCAKR